MGGVKVEVDDSGLAKKLHELQQRTGNIAPALNTVGRKIQTRVKMGFSRGVSPYGEQWKPLKLRDGQPLRDKGNLLSSITYKVAGAGNDQYVDIGTNRRVEWKGNVYSLGAIHQFGAVIVPVHAKFLRFMGPNGIIQAKRVVIPARPFMPIKAGQFVLPDQWATDTLKALKNHFKVP